jgi:beta-lactamase regulating signal transducer with metallopeptidase domain/HEAT repeat protein
MNWLTSHPLLLLLLKEAVVVLIALGLSAVLRRRSASMRHLVWAAAIGAFLVLPFLTLLLPRWEVPVIRKAVTATPAAISGVENAQARKALLAFDDQGRIEPAETAVPLPSPAPTRSIPLTTIAIVLWAAGLVVLLARWVAGTVAVARIASRAVPAAHPATFHTINGRVLISPEIHIPATFGFFRPVILLPAESAEWSGAKLRAVILHEAAHVLRRDWIVLALARVACAAQWFHPLVWVALRQLRTECEKACDDHVLSVEGDTATEYAEHLLDFVRDRRPMRVPSGAVAMARPSQIESRVRAILQGGADRRGTGSKGRALAAAVAVMVLVPVAAMIPVERAVAASSEHAIAGLRNTPVVHRDEGASLAARFASALAAQQKKEEPAWVAWSITSPAFERGVVFADDRGIIDETPPFSDYTRGPSLEQLVAGEKFSPQKKSLREVALMFRVNPDGSIDRARALSLYLNPRTGGETILWLGNVDAEESFRFLRSQKWFERFPERLVVSVLGMHSNSDTVLPWLENLLRTSSSSRLRSEAAEALGFHSIPEAVKLAADTARRDPADMVKVAAVEALQRMTIDDATTVLIDLLSISDPGVRAEVVEALGSKHEARVTDVLEQTVLNDRDERVAFEAAETLGELPSRVALETLVRLAITHPSKHIRREAVESFGGHPLPEVIDVLEQIARKDPDPDVRDEALETLGEMPDRVAQDRLRNLVRGDADPRVRAKATDALTKRSGKEHFDPGPAEDLEYLAWKDPDPGVRLSAVDAISKLPVSVSRELLKKLASHPDSSVRASAVEKMSETGALDVPALSEILFGDGDSSVQMEAMEGLANFSDTQPGQALLRRVVETHEDRDVRRAARELLDEEGESW